MKFGWLSDTHLGYMQYGLERRRNDFAFAFKNAIWQMLQRDIKVIIHSGDLLHSNRPGPDSICELLAVNQLLLQHEAALYVVSGNHDRTVPHWTDVLEKRHTALGIQLLDFRSIARHDDNGMEVRFCGVPYMPPEQFRKHQFPPGDVLVMHQMIQEFIGFKLDGLLTVADLPAGYKLIAMGDVHVNQQMERGGTWVGYPGSTELYSDAEEDVKYWMECTLNAERKLTMERVPIETRLVYRVNILSDKTGDVEQTIATINSMWEKAKGEALEMREPILIVTFLSSIPDVMAKFQTAFNPDKFVIRWKPVFGELLSKSALASGIMEQEELTVTDILRSQLSAKPELFGIASQLINPEIDGNAALNEFIEGRLRSLEAKPVA